MSVCSGNGLLSCKDTRIYINASLPIGVLVGDYSDTVGDSFTVIPTSMAGYNYTVPLPAPASDGSSTAYFLPTENDQTINYVVYFADGTSTGQHSFKAGLNGTNITAYSQSEMYTLYAWSNEPFLITAAVQKLPTSHSSQISTDFGAFMPTPILDTECQLKSLYDVHLSDLSSSLHYIVSPPSSKCAPFKVEVHGTNVSKTMNVFPKSTELSLNISSYGLNMGIVSQAMVSVLRYGGYDIEDFEAGSFLDLDVSKTQFVTGWNVFYVPTNSNIITIFADVSATKSMVLDLRSYVWPFAPVPFTDGSFQYAIGSLPTGLHSLDSPGYYMVSVSGNHDGAGYGFIPAFNGHTVPIKHTTTTISTQSTPGHTVPTKHTTTTISTQSTPGHTVPIKHTATTVSTQSTTGLQSTSATITTINQTVPTVKPKAANKATSILLLLFLPLSFCTLI